MLERIAATHSAIQQIELLSMKHHRLFAPILSQFVNVNENG